MRITQPGRILPESFPEAPDWFRRFVETINPMIETIKIVLSGNVSIADNMFIKKVTQDFTHGVAKSVANPFKTKPEGVLPVAVTADTTGVGQAIGGWTWSYLQSGQLSVTVYFQSAAGSANVLLYVVGG